MAHKCKEITTKSWVEKVLKYIGKKGTSLSHMKATKEFNKHLRSSFLFEVF